MSYCNINQVRIIGGVWRSRKIHFPDLPDLRPTKNQVRETLFNWLHDAVDGSICLDLFAGSGALGFEALSRAAKHVTFVDTSSSVIHALRKNAIALDAQNITYVLNKFPFTTDCLPFLSYDIIFVDPPFGKQWISNIIDWIHKNNLIKKNGFIYLESEIALTQKDFPLNWTQIKTKRSGSLFYSLCRSASKTLQNADIATPTNL